MRYAICTCLALAVLAMLHGMASGEPILVESFNLATDEADGYAAAETLTGDNAAVSPTTGRYTGRWRKGGYFGVEATGLTFRRGDQQLTVSGGCLSSGDGLTPGDLNGDGAFSGLDIPSFKQALAMGSPAYHDMTGIDPDVVGDFNGDDRLSGIDIPGFKAALGGDPTPIYPTRRAVDGMAGANYFSGLIRWKRFGAHGVSRLGLCARGDEPLGPSRVAALRVTPNGVATATLGDAVSGDTVQLSTDTTYLVVGRVETGVDVDGQPADRLTIWIDPALGLEGEPSGGDDCRARLTVTGETGGDALDAVLVQAATPAADHPQVLWADELRLGAAWSEVVPVDPYYAATYEDLMAEVDPLDRPLGDRLPVFIWGNPAHGNPDHEHYVTELYRRGLAWTPNILHISEAAIERLRIMQARGWHRAIIMQTYGQIKFGRLDHEPPAERDPDAHPCLGAYEAPMQWNADRARGHAQMLATRGVTPTVFLFDWEKWCRYKGGVDVNEHAGLRAQWEEAKRCPVCQANAGQYLATPQTYINGMEVLRGKVLREGMFDPLRETFAEALIGNYYTYSHVRSDRPMPDVDRAVGWHGSGADFSQLVAYGNYKNQLKKAEFVGWNCFRTYLEKQTDATRNQVDDEFQLPWTCRVLPGVADPDDENEYNSTITTRNGTVLPLVAWPRDSYREYLRHAMLRGAKNVVIFHPNNNTPGMRTLWLRELTDVLGVAREMQAYDDVLDGGSILTLADLPGRSYSHENAVVWSGMATDDKAVIRAVSFTGENATVTVEVFGRQHTLAAPVGGRTHIIER